MWRYERILFFVWWKSENVVLRGCDKAREVDVNPHLYWSDTYFDVPVYSIQCL